MDDEAGDELEEGRGSQGRGEAETQISPGAEQARGG